MGGVNVLEGGPAVVLVEQGCAGEGAGACGLSRECGGGL